MTMPVNWTREETFKLISLWSEDIIQEQLEGAAETAWFIAKLPMTFAKLATRGLCNNVGIRLRS